MRDDPTSFRREMALGHAARIATPGEPYATTVERARAFLRFLDRTAFEDRYPAHADDEIERLTLASSD